MKTTLLNVLAITVLMTNAAIAQDLIVTKKNDSINASITKVKKEMIYFLFMKAGEVRNTLLPLHKVTTYKENFYKTSEVPSDYKKQRDFKGKRFRIGAEAGFAYRTASIPDGLDAEVEKYLKDLKSGFHWAVNGHYFVNESIGLGLQFNSFYSSNSSNNIQTTFEDGSVENGIKDNMYISFIGPSLLSRITSRNGKNALISGLSIGYMSYKNEEQAGQRFFTTKGDTVGFSFDLGYDIGISNALSFGILASWVTGVINEVEVTEKGGETFTVNLEETIGEKESLARINIAAGLQILL